LANSYALPSSSSATSSASHSSRHCRNLHSPTPILSP
jgi:hypothetical protein